MSTTQGLFVGLAIGSLLLLALFCEPPAFMVALFGWIRGNFTRGRHHVRRDRPTVEAIAKRLRDENRARVHLRIVPDVERFTQQLRDQLGAFYTSPIAGLDPAKLQGLSG